MTGFTDLTATSALGHVTGKTTWALVSPTFLGLFNVPPTDAGVITGEVPLTNAYGRVTTSGAWGTPSAGGTQPSLITNSSAISFPAATGSGAAGWNTINSWGLFSAATGNSLLFWDYLGNFSWIPYSVSLLNSGSGGVFTSPGHGFSNGDQVIISTEYGGSPPTTSSAGGIIAPGSGATPGLVVAGVSGDTFTLTNAGTAILTTSTGDGTLRKIAPQGIAAGVTASFAIGTLTLSMA